MTIPEQAQRPRLRITDSMGRSRTLDDSPAAWTRLAAAPAGAPLILLGLGPTPLASPPFKTTSDTPPAFIAYLEAPDMLTRCPAPAERGVPVIWRALTSEALLNLLTEGAGPVEIWLYAQEPRLFPEFWGPLLGTLRAMLTGARRGPGHPVSPVVLVPGEDSGLLTRELEAAFLAHGYAVTRLPVEPVACLTATTALLKETRPALFFSINLQGLDPEGTLAHVLEACDVPVAVWFVDNPWHCLSRLRLPWWRRLVLFVTDERFVAPLLQHGAAQAHHLPLAAWYSPDTLPRGADVRALARLRPVVFVGRSAFPDREAFFAGCRKADALWSKAAPHLATASPPHVHWWGKELGLESWWPGNACREAGWGAERASSCRRGLWLAEAANHGLTVFGDEGWRTVLEKQAHPNRPATSPPDLRPPLDYYGALPHLYAAARYSLNVTSLLLPAGLTQRHFDVWMAGGFLLTDATPGLALFDSELVREITLPTPDALGQALERFERDPALRPQLAAAWQNALAAAHTYAHRTALVLERTRR